LRIVLGERFPETQIHWDSRGGIDDTNRDWKIMTKGVPIALFQDSLNLIIASPPASEPVLKQLMEMKHLAERLPMNMTKPLRLVNKAIEAVEKALAKEE
jgi:hypothetical protein